MIGVEDYDYIVEKGLPQAAFAGEWTFSESLYGRDNFEEYKTYLEDPKGQAFRNQERREEYLKRVLEIRKQVEPFLERCMNEHPWESYDVIGFTSVFEQHVASLSLAKRLKEKYPDKLIMIGGANCEGEMGETLLEEFPFIDAVCSGEGDISFMKFLSEWNVVRDHRKVKVQGINTRLDETEELPMLVFGKTSEPVHDMDGLPYPNYDDYFQQFVKHGFKSIEQSTRFLFESSRGCWWGAKSHCNFCGLNGGSLAYRSKSADRALHELLYLRDRYKDYTSKASAVDNIIDMSYFRDFLPTLRDMELNLDMFYETKANLTKDQVKLFHDAGFYHIQPGIESLITSVLRLMKKGISMLQNVQLLKYCKQYGVKPLWNFLYGFPNEDESEYQKIPNIIHSLTHLEPPSTVARIRLDRFSPYFDNAADFGIINVRPFYAYHLVYQDQSPEALMKMAYYFEFDYADGRVPSSYTQELTREAINWQETNAESELFHVDSGEHLIIVDLRPTAQQNLITLTGLEKTLYLYCENLRSSKTIYDYLQKSHIPYKAEDVQRILDRFLDEKLMLTESGVYLSLSIPLGDYQPKKKALEKLLEITEQTAQDQEVELIS